MINIQLAPQIHQFQCNTYVISSSGESAIIDPSVPYECFKALGKVKYILLTHAHFDHILNIDDWVNAAGAEVIIGNDELCALTDSHRNCYQFFNRTDKGYFGPATPVFDGATLPLGDTEIKVINCPGHTAGCVAYICEGNAFVGDTAFKGGGYGRSDLPSGNPVLLRESIEKIMKLPDNTILYPGHGDSTTVEEYKRDIGK